VQQRSVFGATSPLCRAFYVSVSRRLASRVALATCYLLLLPSIETLPLVWRP